MEVYKSVYDAMLCKALSYGYVEQQVDDILIENCHRVELSTYKNIPDDERHWMMERWTWEILFADESDAFPGEKPKWKGAANYLKHKSPTAEETPKDTEGEAIGDSLALKEEELTPFSQLNTGERKRYHAVIPKATAATPEEKSPLDDAWSDIKRDLAYQKGTEAPKPSASILFGTRPTSGANKRKRTEPQSDVSDNLDSPKFITRPHVKPCFFLKIRSSLRWSS
ncbi:hypothetical protein OCU04_005339 [Sclerotinia nivalis]|uniref:Uncharacterized protein n=1 Tax=Sclerotinia nivalis TaxID=352851 RepID=A0A9X0DLQ3_9HELO|nr:hypothetical protein OCU04_005339 [Sclerotinia nivalis]